MTYGNKTNFEISISPQKQYRFLFIGIYTNQRLDKKLNCLNSENLVYFSLKGGRKMRVFSINNNIKFFFLISAILCTAAAAKTIYVDDDAAGANDGSSWENAYIYLQEALLDARNSVKPFEIKVAQGVYTPDKGYIDPPGRRDFRTPEEKRSGANFLLISGMSVIGGFAGIDEPDPNARDIEVYKTVLSGD
jgi:hypothetical protein